jgi:Kef-type K+ transport system membrane component KefB
MALDPGGPRSSVAWTALAYGAMLGAAGLLFLWLRELGLGLEAPPPADAGSYGRSDGGPAADALLHVLLALVVILVAARLVGFVFRRLGQPPVIGEVIAGILLGPSLLGRLAPEAFAFLLPPSVAPLLRVIAEVGVILYMFLVGLELDPAHVRRSPHTALAISHASIVVPFLMGSALALGLYPRLATSDVPFTAFVLFLGVSMSVTAFPVLARILTDRGLQASALGVMALTCAAVGDVTAWCLLAAVVSVVQAGGEGVVATVALTAAFIAFVFLALRPLLARAARRLERSPGPTSGTAKAAVFALLLGSALATEWIGIHALFGAFLLGVVIPHDSRLARDLRRGLEDFVVILLLPAFFAFSGLRTEIQLVSGAEEWLLCAAIVLVACAGKFGGSAVAARLSGLPWRQASALGILMNTRGLVELVVLNVGLDLGVISPTLFAMMVVMALVTTLATSPVLDRLTAGERRAAAASAAPARP